MRSLFLMSLFLVAFLAIFMSIPANAQNVCGGTCDDASSPCIEVDSVCCSSSCVKKVLGSPCNATCGCPTSGDLVCIAGNCAVNEKNCSCGVDDECSPPFTCVSQRCRGRAINESCQTTDDCEVGICLFRLVNATTTLTCQNPGAVNDSCSTDDECARTLSCFQGFCRAKVVNGVVCEADSDCISNVCAVNSTGRVCISPQSLADGSSCDAPNQCSSRFCSSANNTCMTAFTKTNGQTCNEAFECSSFHCACADSFCQNKTCADTASRVLNGFCDVDGDDSLGPTCAEGFICGSENRCIRPFSKQVNASCETSIECAPQLTCYIDGASSGTCIRALNETCDFDDDCSLDTTCQCGFDGEKRCLAGTNDNKNASFANHFRAATCYTSQIASNLAAIKQCYRTASLTTGGSVNYTSMSATCQAGLAQRFCCLGCGLSQSFANFIPYIIDCQAGTFLPAPRVSVAQCSSDQIPEGNLRNCPMGGNIMTLPPNPNNNTAVGLAPSFAALASLVAISMIVIFF